jgi:hypothetical protein
MKIMAAWWRGLLTLAILASAGCSSQEAKMAITDVRPEAAIPVGAVQPFAQDARENIARRILQLDAQVKPVTDQMLRTLNEVMDDACSAIGKLRRKEEGGWDRAYAVAALHCVDSALLNHGFLYPDAGGVDLLADGLTPFHISTDRRRFFEAQPSNRRRAAMIAQRFPGPFYVLDCDTASLVYLGVAERANLPLHLVAIPSFNRKAGHAFVRWREGSHYLDWETMEGRVTTDDFYRAEWKITPAEIKAHSALTDLTSGQVMGCEHYLLAIQYERRGDFEKALRELSVALELYPECLDARREFAWDMATGIGVLRRNNEEAIANALAVLRLVDDPDARDTLAAAYASAGMFDLAVKEEKAALVDGARSSDAKAGYQQRLALYQQHTAYRRSGPAHEAAGEFKP